MIIIDLWLNETKVVKNVQKVFTHLMHSKNWGKSECNLETGINEWEIESMNAIE
jgi:hypothetical protein